MTAPAKLGTLLFLAGAFALSVSAASDLPTSRVIDTDHSVMTIRVFKAGLFSAFGHEHEITAPIQQGFFDEDKPSVELTVEAGKLRVMDKGISDRDRAEIQSTMLGPKVLDSERFPQIRFHSTEIERLSPGQWIVHGELTVRDQTRVVKVEVEGQAGHYHGWAEIRQKDFGITPVTVAGGTVRVRNAIRIGFEIVGK